MGRQNIDIHQLQHPLCPTADFQTAEAYVNYLIHRKAYEEAGKFIQGKDVLDWGCNNGYGLAILEEYGCRSLMGLDVSHKAIAAARRRVSSYVELLVFDGSSVPRADHSYDVITSFQCIEHMADPSACLTEMRRLLRVPNGLAIFSTPNAAIRLDVGMKPWNEFHVREYRADELRSLLASCFQSVAVLGLFGEEKLQEIEVARCDRARRRARGERGPDVQEAVIQMRRKSDADALGNESEWRKYSAADLFYSDDNLGAACDLMAVCRVQRGGDASRHRRSCGQGQIVP